MSFKFGLPKGISMPTARRTLIAALLLNVGHGWVAAGEVTRLRAGLLLTDDEAGVRRQWADASRAPQIKAVTSAKVGDDISTVVLFENCPTNALGNCELSARFALQTPDGQRIEAGEGSLWSSAPIGGKLMLGAASVSFTVGPEWAAGRYTVSVMISDRVQGQSLGLAAPLDVSK